MSALKNRRVKKFEAFTGLIFAFLILLLHPLFVSGIKNIKSSPRYGGIFRIKAFSDSFRVQLDPASTDSFIFVSEQIYDGLLKLDRDFNVVPSLAEYWEISPDSKKYTFYLRKGIKFHDGKELSAEDVKFTLERLLDKKTNSPYFQYFISKVEGARDFRDGKTNGVSGFKVINKYTFEISWTIPYVSGLYLLGMHFCKILPQDLVIKQGKKFFFNPKGTGPFRFDSWIRTPKLEIVGIKLKRNNSYFGGMPYLDGIEFCPLYNLNHFFNKEIDFIPVLSEKLLKSHYQILQDSSLNLIFLGMSCHISPLDSPLVRKAFGCGIDKEKILQEISDKKSTYKVENNYIPPVLPGFLPLDREKKYDLNKARQYLREAGFSDENKFPSLTLLFSLPKSKFKSKFYEALNHQLEALGIKLHLKYYRSSEKLENYDKPYLIFKEKIMDFPDPEDVIRPLFFSESLFNIFGYESAELDSLLYEAEVERSWTKRIQIFHKIEEILFSDIPAIPLFSCQKKIAMQPDVRGVEVPPLGLQYLEAEKIWFDNKGEK